MPKKTRELQPFVPLEKDSPTPVARTMSLKDIRTNIFHMTIEEFATLIGTKRSTYWFWEKDKKKMPGIFGERIKELLAKHRTQAVPTVRIDTCEICQSEPVKPSDAWHLAGHPKSAHDPASSA